MTKTLKKLASIIVTVVMVMALGVATIAAENPVVTIQKNDTNDKSAHSYEFYQVFSASVETDKSLYDIEWGTGVNSSASDFYTKLNAVAGFESCTSADDVVAVLSGDGVTNDSTIVDAFAKFISGYTSSSKVTATLGASDTSANATLTSGYGYYFVKDTITTSPVVDGAVSKFMLKVVNETTGITISTKAAVPTLDKDIVETSGDVKQNQASVGDTITFKLTSSVPDLRNKGYNKYCFVMNDTLSKGLTYVGTSTTNAQPTITIGSKTLTSSEYDFSSTTDAVTDETKLEIVFKDFLTYGTDTDYIGEDITVTYTAELNENADSTQAGNPNTATLIYSNDPSNTYNSDKPGSDDVTGKSPDVQTVTYTTGAKVIKTDASNNVLTGAKFKITGTSSDQVIVTKTVYEEDADGSYYKLTDGTYTETAPTSATADKYASTTVTYSSKEVTTLEEQAAGATDITVEVDADGSFLLTGLGKGTYTITETVPPAGYVIDGIEHSLVIDCTIDSTTKKPTWTYTIDGVSATPVGDYVVLKVIDKKTSDLPETGSIGKAVFYIAGAMLVVTAAGLIVLKKRIGEDTAR